MARKISRGRQRVDMVKMPNETNLQVTFSKRRSGLFKKASELCTLCGAEIAVIVFSPGKKVFSFGHPCVDSVVDRFLSRNPPPSTPTMQLIEAHRNANVRDLNAQLSQVLYQLEMERKRGEQLTRMKKASQSQYWWESPVEELTFPQLDQLRFALENLKQNVSIQAEKIVAQNSHSPQFFPSSSTHPPVLPNFDPNINNNINISSNNNNNNGMFNLPVPDMGAPYGYNNFGYGHGFY